LSADNISDALFASLTVAGYFPPAKVFDHEYISGSAYWDLDIYDSVLKCKAMGFDESDIIIDTVMTSSANEITDVDADGYKSIRMLMRFNSISSYYNSYDGYTRAKFAFKDATFRHLFQPSENLHDSDKPFHMSQKEMEHMIDVGVKDATQELSNPVDIKDQMFYYYLKKTGDSRINGYSYGEFLEGQKVGAFGEYDVYSDPYARKYVNKLTEEQKIKFLAF
jgi:succinate dehydrogenase flavin-adding protein (antitoxin of CptAB toxin-antitoxin module)